MTTTKKTATDSYLSSLTADLLTREDEVSLAAIIQDKDNPEADKAREKMIEANLRLVAHVAKKYRARARKLGVSYIDLIQEGNIGLMTAAEKFDGEMGNRFSTYAVYWIRQAIGRSLQNKASTIRVPVHVHEVVSKLKHAARIMGEMTGEDPMPAEVAAFLELPEDKVTALWQYIRPCDSLDRPVGSEDGDSVLGDFVEDTDHNLTDAVDDAASKSIIHTMLRTLTPKEEKVLRLRFAV